MDAAIFCWDDFFDANARSVCSNVVFSSVFLTDENLKRTNSIPMLVWSGMAASIACILPQDDSTQTILFAINSEKN